MYCVWNTQYVVQASLIERIDTSIGSCSLTLRVCSIQIDREYADIEKLYLGLQSVDVVCSDMY